jgi:hypothetical protein
VPIVNLGKMSPSGDSVRRLIKLSSLLETKCCEKTVGSDTDLAANRGKRVQAAKACEKSLKDS